MFFSQQLLARKASMGQIWMAATMRAKMNRKKLEKLNIIQICEEILNPPVPLALRLSGILMGGVVIVYERKVKLLYDDVNRLLHGHRGKAIKEKQNSSALIMDYEQQLFLVDIYQSWLQDTSDIAEEREEEEVRICLKAQDLTQQPRTQSGQVQPKKGIFLHLDKVAMGLNLSRKKPFEYPEPDFNLSRLAENGSAPDPVFVETGPTQTQLPVINPALDKITDAIRMNIKTHFDAPGASKEESLNALAAGLNRKGAAMLFYQTCVLATRDYLKVEQKEPYGDISISKGAKM
ncbi:sister chromatid cohesion 1 protein 1-like [Pistacia vera]|uniref:sister chromatid cohesion 1 protein 1-like n=1 Tax=Pistacia vera TaxID=55513 RepID=UPI0012637940|nr:sister chromatid cohesion 1 protein 1-like [Pistacia vera]